MAENSLYYYIRKAGLDSSLEFSYSFKSPLSGINIPVETGDSAFSGTLYGQTGNFWSPSGSGHFSGNAVKVNSADLIEKSDWTAFLIFERQKTGQQVLLSTMGSGDPSGVLFGINDASKYYISAWDEQGFFNTKTFSLPMGNKNGITLSKNGSTFSILDFNFQEEEGYLESYSYPLTAVTESDNLFFGGTLGVPSGIDSGCFYGYIDEVVFLSNSLSVETSKYLFKSFYMEAPVLEYQLLKKSESYNYQDLNRLKNIQFDSLTSGGLDYIRQNIFNRTGIGQIMAVSSGDFSGTSGVISGYLSGQVYLPTGVSKTVTGTRVTGYLTSGNVATASGITGYSQVSLYPFAAFTGDVYQVSGLSGITGVTEWTPTYTGPIYETYTETVYVEDRVFSNVYQTFSYLQTGLLGRVAFTHTGIYVNNGSDKINTQNILRYSGSAGEVNPFTVIKTSALDYGSGYTEGDENENFIKTFYMDGVISYKKVGSGEKLNLHWLDSTGESVFNRELLLDLSSGNFKTESDETAESAVFFINGILQPTGEQGDITSSFSGNYLSQNLTWDRNDLGIYDSHAGVGYIKTYGISGATSSGFTSGTLIFSGQHSGMVFLNGQNLVSGVDFEDRASGIYLTTNLYSGISGSAILINAFEGTLSGNSTGNSALIKDRFPKKSSQFFKNGVRQFLGADYKEVGSYDNLYFFTGQREIELEEITP
jgi:hypothetical protein